MNNSFGLNKVFIIHAKSIVNKLEKLQFRYSFYIIHHSPGNTRRVLRPVGNLEPNLGLKGGVRVELGGVRDT